MTFLIPYTMTLSFPYYSPVRSLVLKIQAVICNSSRQIILRYFLFRNINTSPLCSPRFRESEAGGEDTSAERTRPQGYLAALRRGSSFSAARATKRTCPKGKLSFPKGIPSTQGLECSVVPNYEIYPKI